MAEEHTIGLRINQFERRFSRDGQKYTDYVELYNISGMDPTGNVRSSTWHRIKDLEPTEEFMQRDHLNEEHALAVQSRWADIQPKYEAWLAGQELPQDGVPLAAWAGLTKPQADGLQQAGYRTVEEVANMPDGMVDKIPLPGLRSLRKAAQDWLDSRDSVALQDQVAALQAELEAMRTERAGVDDTAEEDLLAPPAEPETGEPPRAKRGRPAKVDA